MKTWKIQWCTYERVNIGGGHGEPREVWDYRPCVWKDLWAEEWGREEHAEMRVKGYWEKLGLPLSFRIVEVVPHESPQLLPAVE